MSGFWSWWIIVLTVLNIGAAVWLMIYTSKSRVEPEETTGHVWDGDLQEYNNPLPRWWLWLFYITVAFAIGYLIVFPGLGRIAGVAGWTQIGQYDEEVARAEQAYGDVYAQFAGMDFSELAADERAMGLAHNLYANNCATCHGSDARGAIGFPNLTDDDWLYGGDPESILASILNGRMGVMPPWGQALGEQGVEEVAVYVLTLSGGSAPEDWIEAGRQKFATFCATCHGAEGQGMQALGAPNLTDDIWLYGGTLDDIRTAIVQGRQNQMPAQRDILGETKSRLLTAYLLNLSRSRSDVVAREQ